MTSHHDSFCVPHLPGTALFPITNIQSFTPIEYLEEYQLLPKHDEGFPQLAQELAQYQATYQQKQAEEVLDFNHHCQSIWHIINVKYESLNATQLQDSLGDAEDGIEAALNKIGRATRNCTSFETRRNATFSLCKIGRTICTGDSEIRRELRKSGIPSYLTNFLKGLIEEMSQEQRELLKTQDEKGDGSFAAKLCELVRLAYRHGIMEDLEGCLGLLHINLAQYPNDVDVNEKDAPHISKKNGKADAQTQLLANLTKRPRAYSWMTGNLSTKRSKA